MVSAANGKSLVARIEHEAERGLGADQRRSPPARRPAGCVSADRVRAVAGPEQFQECRQRPPGHQGVGAQQGRGDAGGQQRAPSAASRRSRSFHRTSCRRRRRAGCRPWSPRCATAIQDASRGVQGRRRSVSQAAPNTRTAKRHAASHLQLPERIIADGIAGRIFHRALHGIEQAPIAADGALELALPRLVVGLDQIDAKVLPLRQSRGFPRPPGPGWCATAAPPRASAPRSASRFRRSGFPCPEMPPPSACGWRRHGRRHISRGSESLPSRAGYGW